MSSASQASTQNHTPADVAAYSPFIFWWRSEPTHDSTHVLIVVPTRRYAFLCSKKEHSREEMPQKCSLVFPTHSISTSRVCRIVNSIFVRQKKGGQTAVCFRNTPNPHSRAESVRGLRVWCPRTGRTCVTSFISVWPASSRQAAQPSSKRISASQVRPEPSAHSPLSCSGITLRGLL